MLDIKHKNIGATVALVKQIHKVVGLDTSLPKELTRLFMAESSECDYRVLNDDESISCLSKTAKCCVGNCPLGDKVIRILGADE